MNQLTLQDYEILSTYLDGELASAEARQLDARLMVDVELMAALRDLRRTRQVLRSLPTVRAPRNFTLTPEMAGIRRPDRSWLQWFSTLRFSSALAGLLLLLVLMGDFLTGLTPLAGLSNTAMDTAMVEAYPAAEEPSALESDSAVGAYPAPLGDAQLEAEASSAGTELFEQPQQVVQLTPTPSAEMALPEGLTAPQVEGDAVQKVVPVEPPPDQQLQPTPQPIPRGLGGGGGGDGLGAGPVQESSEPLFTRDTLRITVRIIEVSLLLVAVGAALAAWIIRRRSV
jgi:anti-sigma factor RsiW